MAKIEFTGVEIGRLKRIIQEDIDAWKRHQQDEANNEVRVKMLNKLIQSREDLLAKLNN